MACLEMSGLRSCIVWQTLQFVPLWLDVQEDSIVQLDNGGLASPPAAGPEGQSTDHLTASGCSVTTKVVVMYGSTVQ